MNARRLIEVKSSIPFLASRPWPEMGPVFVHMKYESTELERLCCRRCAFGMILVLIQAVYASYSVSQLE